MPEIYFYHVILQGGFGLIRLGIKNLNYFSDLGIYGNGTLTWMVHGGGNTINIRLALYRHLRDKVFDYSNKCVNKIKPIKKENVVNESILKQKGCWSEVKNGEY